MTKIYQNHEDFINRAKAETDYNGVTQQYLNLRNLTLETLNLTDCTECFNCTECTGYNDYSYCNYLKGEQ